MSKYEQQIQSLVESGELSPEAAEQLLDASPLRQEAKSAKEEAAALKGENEQLRQQVLRSTFKDAGVKVDPSALKLPEDLKHDDVDAVRTWAVEKGLLDPPPPTEPAELAAHDKQATAAAGTQGGSDGPSLDELIAQTNSEEELNALIAANAAKFNLATQ